MATLQERYDSGTIATQSGVADMVLLETQKITQWAADVVYNQNQVVYATTGSGGHNFMSLVNNNVGNPVTDTTKWQDLGVGGLNQTNVGKAMRFKDLAEQVVAKNAALTAVTNGGNADAQHVHSLDAISEKNDIMLKSVYATNTDGVMVDKAATVNVPSTAASGDAYVVGTDGTASFEHRIFVPTGSSSNQFLGNVSGNLQWVNKTDIIAVVDALDSTDGTMALSANQGRVLANRVATTSSVGGVIVGAGLAVAANGLLSAALPTLTKTTITSSGTWTAPADGVVCLILVGGGGGGGDRLPSTSWGGPGGGAGGISIAIWAVAAGDQIAISIGAGGAPTNQAAKTGGDTSATYDGETVTAGGGWTKNSVSGSDGGQGGEGNVCNGQAGFFGTYDTSGWSVPGHGGGAGPGAGGHGSGGTDGKPVAATAGANGVAHVFFIARPAAQ